MLGRVANPAQVSQPLDLFLIREVGSWLTSTATHKLSATRYDGLSPSFDFERLK